MVTKASEFLFLHKLNICKKLQAVTDIQGARERCERVYVEEAEPHIKKDFCKKFKRFHLLTPRSQKISNYL